jgi:Amt family ammonium transporter
MHSTVRSAVFGNANEIIFQGDSGDTAFVIMCAALVLMMSFPGIVLFHAGMSGFKSVLNIVVQTVVVASFITILWLMFGYSLAFGEGRYNNFIGGSEKFWFMGTGSDAAEMFAASTVGKIPESVFIMFQLGFAIFTAAITASSFAERMTLQSMLVFFFFWLFFVYCPVAHWNWGRGFMYKWGVLDFAGGNIVHIVAGTSGLVGSLILGPRQQDETVRSEHTELLTFIGGCLLWIGWFGFTAGSALQAGASAGLAMLVTHICASTCAFAWALIEWLHKGKPTVVGVMSGAVTGLIVITPGAGFVDQSAAFCIGLACAGLCYGTLFVKNRFSLDQKPSTSNYPDAFGVHLVAGWWGGFMVGLFANPDVVPGIAGAFYKNQYTLGWQIAAMLITCGWSGLVTAILFFFLKFTMGINVVEAKASDAKADPENPAQPAAEAQPAPAVSPLTTMVQPAYPMVAPVMEMGTA